MGAPRLLRFAAAAIVAGVGVGFVGGESPARAADTPLELTVTTLDFGDVVVGSKREMDVQITNTGNAPFGPVFGGTGSITSPAFGTVGSTCNGVTLAVGESCLTTIRFSPDTTGPFSATGTVSFGNVLGDLEEATVTLTGNGVLPLSVTPTLDFGDVVVGSKREMDVQITNTGNAPFGPVFGGTGSITSPAFGTVGSTCNGVTLAVGESCLATIRFSPDTTGPFSATGTVSFGNVLGDLEEATVTLTGNGIAGPAAPPIAADVSELEFGDVAVGGSRTLFVRFTNTGTVPYGPLVIIGGDADDPVFSVDTSDCLSATLQPMWSCDISYTFTPSTLGVFTAAAIPTLTLTDQAAGETFPIALSGTGSDPDETPSTEPEDTAPPTTDPPCASDELVAPDTTSISTATTVAATDITDGPTVAEQSSTTLAMDPGTDGTTIDDATATESSDGETVESDVADSTLEAPLSTSGDVADESTGELHGFSAARQHAAAVCAPADDDPAVSTIPASAPTTVPDGSAAGGSGGGGVETLPATR